MGSSIGMDVGYMALCAFMGVLGGMGVGVMHASFEHFWYYFLDFLYRRGYIRRLAPSIPITQWQSHYSKESFLATSIGPIPVSAASFYLRKGFASRCQLSGDIVGALLFTWTVMVLHDAYFFAVHTLMHRVKAVYRRVHQWHHATHGEVTVFSTAYGDILDVAFTFGPFYSMVVAYIYYQPSWNPLHVVCLMWAVNGVDMMGHCGFKLPLWVYVPGSLGVLLTPGAQRPKHHFIHHLDPRYNRSLYFTWWDRIAGSFREHHPRVVEQAPGES